MRCPFCSYGESKVVDSRPTDDGERIRRRRECLRCQRRFTTYEAIETVPLMVLKKDGSIEGFDRNKLFNSMLRACEKRQVSLSQIERAVDEIELTLQNSLARECPSSQIGEMAMEQLKTIDEAAYVRFASVYRQFKDIGSFMEELKNLLAHSAGESESSEGQGNKKD
ncbi:MAG: transcriptional regulator NrdR [Oscillospiraceae bacterium]|nr:transcriptional repressor NrdR [Oscillospiraceae bacterium]MDY3219156.1 transcriptional regulator NrdR [Candidatus Fimivivens sp.]SFJ17569.1 transcriptional repressor NrdR [Ruminococcaceae bacterium D5]GKH51477.1 transcriptional repressor NrdR [Eubacteriales bacterium]MCI6027399.1 transcriptional regulator NrdR [Oscillospiraceae bacterium]